MRTFGLSCVRLRARIPAGPEALTRASTCCIAQHGSPTCCVDRERLSVFAELQDAVEEVLPTLKEQGISVYILSETCRIQGVKPLSDKISQASDQPLSWALRASVNIRSTALYIYTSGTTGTLTHLVVTLLGKTSSI